MHGLARLGWGGGVSSVGVTRWYVVTIENARDGVAVEGEALCYLPYLVPFNSMFTDGQDLTVGKALTHRANSLIMVVWEHTLSAPIVHPAYCSSAPPACGSVLLLHKTCTHRAHPQA